MNEVTTRFVTFYSYKGGVGRTSALVNVAVLRAMQGNNVLILDFDLEAPGTTPYLRKLDPEYDEHKEGLLEYFAAAIDGTTVPPLASKAIDLSGRLDGENGGRLWAINAGNTIDSNYTARLEKLNWTEIFQRKFGDLLLRNFKNQIIEEFARPDYVFIDSRTGITEIGGVCTRYLADILVILTSLNEQNINGTAMIHHELLKEGKESILVAANVPVGMPYSIDQLFSKRIDSFSSQFGRSPDLFVYYYPVLSLSEELPALLARASEEKREHGASLFSTDPLLQSYRRLAQVIDRTRKGQISYMASLRGAARELFRYFHTKDVPDEINVLKQYYADRLLAKIILDIFGFGRHCSETPTSPQNWNTREYSRLMEFENQITNSSVREAIEALQHFVFRLLKEYLDNTGVMERSLEMFVDQDHVGALALEEISRERFDWPIDYLQRTLKTISVDNHATMTRTLYNLSHCLLQIGQNTRAHKYLERFLKEFKQLDFSTYSAPTKANYYFCAALAYQELGLMEEASSMRQKTEEQASVLKPDTVVFSPLDYKLISIGKFTKQLESSVEMNVARKH